jgi:hypothetical protein
MDMNHLENAANQLNPACAMDSSFPVWRPDAAGTPQGE